MKLILLIFSIVCIIGCRQKDNSHQTSQLKRTINGSVNSNTPKTLAFSRGNYIYIKELPNKKPQQLANGYDPSLSPDGSKIVYTSYNNKYREIAIIDLISKKEHKLDLKGKDAHHPTWSTDSKHIAFALMKDYVWKVGVMDTQNEEISVIGSNTESHLYQPSWNLNSKSILFHNLADLFIYDVNEKKITKKIELDTFLRQNLYITQETKFFLSNNSKHLIFNAETEEYNKDWNLYNNALFAYSLKTKNIKRLTRKQLHCIEPWMDRKGNMYFSAIRNNLISTNIYKINLKDTVLIKIIDNGDYPSLTRGQ
jgi:Tol biopolymer transport system component